ncbi:MAG: molybdate ABC transporter substrate-binding protein [Methylobacillus sp.]|jgi:molybdate transport system substrate-binding protein|nr:molybdate ABC transporter substrate-binding protein [Methylobacillus sp.]
MKVFRAALLAVALLFTHALAHAEILTVAVAANMKFVFGDLAAVFTKESGIAIQPVYNSSGKLVAQVREGAPYDVFLAADMEFPAKLVESGQAAAKPEIYAYGKLVLWTLNDKLDLGSLAVLRDARVRKIAIANPKVAPYGRLAMNVVHGIANNHGKSPSADIMSKLVYAEDIAQVAMLVDSGNADVGLTAKSLLMSSENARRGYWMDIPGDEVAQGAVILKYGQSKHGEAARKFYDFLYSARARAILEKFGYGLP